MKFQHSKHLNNASILLMLLILAIPMFTFIATAIYYSVNIPFYDDITQILWLVNAFLEGKVDPSTPEFVYAVHGRLHAIFYPSSGHVPMVTRLFALTQYYMGGVNFYYAAVISCGFWVLSVFLLLRYAYKAGLPLFVLLPLPFLLFSLAQWEAMSSMLGSIQMYIGTLFLPLLLLLTIVKNRPVIAALIFFIALFSSGGAMGLLPLCAVYLLWRHKWKSCALFCLLSLPSVLLFRHLDIFGPVLMAQRFQNLSFADPAALAYNILIKIEYFLVFLGNITTNGLMDLRPLVTIQLITGILLLIGGSVGIIFCRGYELFKLIFIYMLMLALSTALMRSDPSNYGIDVVPRYAVFALLASAMVYLLLMQVWAQRQPNTVKYFVFLIALSSAGLWVHSIKLGNEALHEFRKSRIIEIQYYIQTGDASRLMWDAKWCDGTLKKAKQLNVYDYSATENFQ